MQHDLQSAPVLLIFCPINSSSYTGSARHYVRPSMSRKSLPQLAPASKSSPPYFSKSHLLNTVAADTAASSPFARSPIDPRSMLSIAGLPLSEVSSILDLANNLDRQDPSARSRRLAHRRVALLFYESSTRTRTCFELAAKSLGATTTLVSAKSSSIEKGESLKDTGLTLRALGAEAIILRHPASGAPSVLAHTTGLPVLNAGDGMHQHPSQALLDLRTILARLHPRNSATVRRPLPQNTPGLTLTITGDIRPLPRRPLQRDAPPPPGRSRPPLRSRPSSSPKRPPPCSPKSAGKISPATSTSAATSIAASAIQIVMMLRIQEERLADLELDLDAYVARYPTQPRPPRRCHTPIILVLHPGPMIRGLEISGEVADGPNSAIPRAGHPRPPHPHRPPGPRSRSHLQRDRQARPPMTPA